MSGEYSTEIAIDGDSLPEALAALTPDQYRELSPILKRRLSLVQYRLTGVKWNYELGDLPNHDQFKFIGLMIDGDQCSCRVQRVEDSTHSFAHRYIAVDDYAGHRVFTRMIAWRNYQQGNPQP